MRVYHPSQLGSIQLCPRFLADKSEDSIYAQEGRMLHKILSDNESAEGLSERHNEVITVCRNYEKTLIAKYPAAKIQKEVKYEVQLSPEVKLTGTMDMLVKIDENNYHIVDWKTGEGDVLPAKDNLQTIAYALMLYMAHNPKRHVTTTLVCPLNPNTVMTEHVWSAEDLPHLRAMVEAVIARSEDKMMRPVLNWTACRYCANKAKCQEMAEVIFRASDTFTAESTGLILRPTAALTPEIRGKRHRLADLLEDAAKQIKQDNVRAVLEDGETVEGYRLTRRRGKMSVQNTGMAFQALREAGYSEEVLLASSELKVTPLVAAIKAVEKGDEAEIQKKLKTLLEDNMTEGEPVVYLKRERKRKDYNDKQEEQG